MSKELTGSSLGKLCSLPFPFHFFFCYPTLCQLPANGQTHKIAASTAIGAKDVCTSEKARLFSLLDSPNQTASRWGNVRGERHKDVAPGAP